MINKSKFKSIVAILMILLLTVQQLTVAVGAIDEDVKGSVDFTITNPYENVDWDNWKPYKGATHVHSNISDGDINFKDMVEKYYELGYDCLSMTDHGTVNYGWTASKKRHPIFLYQAITTGSVDPLSTERANEIVQGVGRDGRGMIDIPYGIELNGSSIKKVHINSYFADAGDGDMALASTWPTDAVAKSHNAGGLTHINHVGEWSGGEDDIGVYTQDFVNDFAKIFLDYSSCLGIELVNTSDNRTKNDRYLYDETLKITAPQGRNIFGFCEDDAHDYGDCDRNAQIFWMPSNTVENVRECMETGAFFACSKNAKSATELGDGFGAVGDYPSVSRVTVDQDRNTISFEFKNANKAKMVADGNIIAEADFNVAGDGFTVDLNAFEDQINSYVRFYLMGPGGICYVQPFLVTKSEYKISSVQFNLPSNDTTFVLKDSEGNVIENTSDYKFFLPAGDYTYSAYRDGYKDLEDVEFTITQNEFDIGQQFTFNVELVENLDDGSAFFYVPETIYLDTDDLKTFEFYVDRENALTGKLNASVKTTGNIFFHREGATNINLLLEAVNGPALENISGGPSSAEGDTLVATLNSAALAEALPTGTGCTIKWTVTYDYMGETYVSTSYSYVYAPLVGASSAAAAAGEAGTNRGIFWLHSDMSITGAAYVSGVHSVTGGTASYAFAPYGGTAPTYGSSLSAISATGTGLATASDEDDGDSVTLYVTGGTGHLTVDTSRYTNYSQIPNLTVGVDLLHENSTEDNNVTQSLSFGSTTLASYNRRAYDLGVSRMYSTDNTDPSKAINVPIDVNTTNIGVTGQIQGSKSNKVDTVIATANLNLTYVDKSELREGYIKEVRAARQAKWYSNTAYSAYMTALQNAGTVLGNPTSTAAQCENSLQLLKNSVANLNGTESVITSNVINKVTGDVIKTSTKTVFGGDTVVLEDINIKGYTLDSAECLSGGESVLGDGEDRFTATAEEYTINYYVVPAVSEITFSGADDFTADDTFKTATYGSEYTLPASPVKTGYDFAGWKLVQTDDVYEAGESFTWKVEDDAEFEAQWTAKTYTVSYNVNDAEFTGVFADAVYGEEYVIPAEIPTKDGFEFTGWTFSEDGNTYNAGDSFVWEFDVDDATFTANWTGNDYTVSVDLDGGEFTGTFADAVYGEEYVIPAEIPTKDNYKFTGWLLSADGETYNAGDVITWSFDEEVTFTAQWKLTKTQYTINYYYENAEDENFTFVNAVKDEADIGETITAEIPEVEGMKFNEYLSTTSGEVTEDGLLLKVYYSRNLRELTITTDKCKGVSDITLSYGDYTGTGTLSVLVKYGAPLKSISASSSKSMTFCGWFSVVDGEEQFLSDKYDYFAEMTMPDNDVEILSVWTAYDKHEAGNLLVAKDEVIRDVEDGFIVTTQQGIYDITENIYLLGEYEVEYEETMFGFGTGTVIKLVADGEVIAEYTLVVTGDINGDGYVDAFDVPDVMAFVNYDSQYEAGSAQEKAADVDFNGYVDESDLFLVDLVSTFAYEIV